VEVALAVQGAKDAQPHDTASFLDELIVRRELSMHFVHFNPDYDGYGALPAWAKQTLGEHAKDEREHVYGCDRLEAAATHDAY
jgi:deoxyribodipyrimidine photo-lyase